MKKYAIEDLVIDAPEEKKRKKGRKKKGKSSKRKYIITTLILTALIALIGISIVLINSTAHYTMDEDIQVSTVEDPMFAELKKDFINTDEIEVSDTNELPKQKLEMTDPTKQTAQDVNDTLSLENNRSVNTVTKEKNETIVNDDIIAVKKDELPETNQDIAKTTKTEKPAEQKPLRISDILLHKNSVEAPAVVAEKKVSKPKVVAKATPKPEVIPEPKKVPQSKVVREAAPKPKAIPKPKKAPRTKTIPEAIPKPKIVSKMTPKPKVTAKVASNAIELEENIKAEKAEENVSKNEKILIYTKTKSTQKAKSKQNSFFDIISNKTKYYIQVGTYPIPTLLSKLENAKLRYLVTRNKGKYKTIVGPYSSMRSAKSAIKSIKKSTKINGILVKMKTK